jgi:hypothetical protein
VKYLVRALSAEILKTKRTLALGLALLAPLSIAFLAFVVSWQAGPPDTPAEGWRYFVQNGHILWNLLMLPLFVTLEMGLLGNLEHGNRMWKTLYALPAPRWSVYIAKQLIALVLVGLSSALLIVFLFLAGSLLNLINPAYGFGAAFPWAQALGISGITFLCAWLIIAFHLWFSIRIPSFVAAMGLGIVAVVASVLVIESKYAPYYPWTLSGTTVMAINQAESYSTQLLVGLAGGILIALIGCWDATRRDVL